jgi:hypothetical protein
MVKRGVAVEKVGFSEESRKSGDRKCPGDWGNRLQSFLTRSNFCKLRVSEFFNSHGISHLSNFPLI